MRNTNLKNNIYLNFIKDLNKRTYFFLRKCMFKDQEYRDFYQSLVSLIRLEVEATSYSKEHSNSMLLDKMNNLLESTNDTIFYKVPFKISDITDLVFIHNTEKTLGYIDYTNDERKPVWRFNYGNIKGNDFLIIFIKESQSYLMKYQGITLFINRVSENDHDIFTDGIENFKTVKGWIDELPNR